MTVLSFTLSALSGICLITGIAILMGKKEV